MSEERKDVWVKWCARVLVLFIVGVGSFMAYPSYKRCQALKLQDADLQRRIDKKHQEIAELRENQRRFNCDADFVESIARQNRRVFPGELVFIFEDD